MTLAFHMAVLLHQLSLHLFYLCIFSVCLRKVNSYKSGRCKVERGLVQMINQEVGSYDIFVCA